MIFYFTGTGNSLQVAKDIANSQGEPLISIASLMRKEEDVYEYSLGNTEKVGFVFPIYAWGPPKIVLDFIQKLKLNHLKDNYIFGIATCGENIGEAMGVLEKELKKKNIGLHSGFSVVMPNNYMVMGMDVDSEEESKKKLAQVTHTLEEINRVIQAQEKGVFHLEKGTLPSVLTRVVNPLFSLFSIDTRKFYANDRCISCGICEKVCNTKNIKVEGKPTWGSQCTQCLACINICPVKAIEYGKGTVKRGRYRNPNVTVAELEGSI